MTKLTKVEKAFLKKHQIDECDVFDGAGFPRSYVYRVMKCEDKDFYIGTRCNRANHRIRTRAGHCAQCSTSAIAFQRRHGAIGQVYVAEAEDVGLVKVGSSSDAKERMNTLNEYDYAGSCSWKLKAIGENISKAGKVEFHAHALLKKHRASAGYFKDGGWHDCQEVFSCSWEVAKDALQKAVDQVDRKR